MNVFEQIRPGLRVRGLSGASEAEIVSVKAFGAEAAMIAFRTDGRIFERLLYREEAKDLELLEGARNWSFDADPALARLASEAYRIRLAHLFDPYLAVTASDVEALPHQITAVYGEMLPRQPLRFLLADDPGAGKTIMAGLLIKELLIRGDLERCLILAPGGLVEQWREELRRKFDLAFDLLTRERLESSPPGEVFAGRSRLIARLDMTARSEALKAELEAAPDWDLVICDEAHRMAASYFNGEVKETQRHKLGKLLGRKTRNLLLMTATPHNGKEADFQLFMGLLDADRFEGRPREGAPKADVSDMMRRLTKEELFRFDETPLFPERRAHTVAYAPSPAEARLYQGVTTYVREEMNRADRVGDGRRRSSVGFALQILQRRLASSPAAIHRSLERRRRRLETRLDEARNLRGGALHHEAIPDFAYDPDEIDEAAGEEIEAAEEALVDQASAAETLVELEAEILHLRDLEAQALAVKLSGEDSKWRQLDSILDAPEMIDQQTGARRKVLIFTEPRDTLEYLRERLAARIGDQAAVVVIHGGVSREARRTAVAAFNSDPEIRMMIANDAAGEGVNLQRGAHLMINYDLPWNPNRLEQRFGRIHRIGQTEVCHLWNLVAAETREGEVYRRLLEKLEEARAALGGKVYDVLGALFEGRPLRALLVEAIRHNDSPEVRRALFRRVEGAVDLKAIRKLTAERKLASEGMAPAAVAEVREAMERAAARRLQPHFIGGFFREAFARLGGRMGERERGRFEITRVPDVLKDRARADPVLSRYVRVAFDKAALAGSPQAELLAPGHPLLDALVEATLDGLQPLLTRGAILVDETDQGLAPRLLVYLEHALRNDARTDKGEFQIISRRLQFVALKEDGSAEEAGPAPYLDLRPITAEERSAVEDLLSAPWLTKEFEARALSHAVERLVPRHLAEEKTRRSAEIDKIAREVRARLIRERDHWDARAARLRAEERAGRENRRLNARKAEANAERMVERLTRREAELERERRISALAPQIRGVVLAIPAGLLADRLRLAARASPEPSGFPPDFPADSAARAEVEARAMAAAMEAERRLGHEPRDVSAEKKGWDVESRDGATGVLRFLEVKGRREDAETVILTKNEILAALNAPEAFILVIVRMSGDRTHDPVYIRRPPFREPGFAEAHVAFRMADLLRIGGPPD